MKGLIAIIPVEKNHEYEVLIEALSSEGSGIARIDGYTLFVPQTVRGDRVRVLVLKTKASYGYAKVLEIIEPSPDRVISPCAHFSKCGGCQLMALRYDAQLEFKRQTVCDALLSIGGIDVKVDIIGMDEPQRYRNKMVFLHYPPRYRGYECREIIELLERYEVRRCFYGHLHSESHKLAVEGLWGGVEYRLVSADYIGFKPVTVIL